MNTTRAVWIRLLLLSIAAVAIAHLLDPLVWRHVRYARVHDTDWGRMLRSVGYLPVWGLTALAMWLHQRRTGDTNGQTPSDTQRIPGRDAAMLVLAPALAAGLGELLKMLIRRMRPDPELFGYLFRPFADAPFSSRGLGIPSTHTIVAFGAAAVLARLFPRARWVFYVAAAGCAVTRLLALGHFFSDVVAGAAIAIIVTKLLWDSTRS